jgi:hypothetical protein
MAKVTQHVPKDQAIADTCGVGRARGHSAKPPKKKPTLADWHRYLELMARLVIHDPVYIPIFKRVEAEIARATEEEDVISRARKIAGAAGRR